jgi:hypothetical protein
MTTRPSPRNADPDMIGAEAALRRAARRAREVARQKGTPVVVWRDGRVVQERVDD